MESRRATLRTSAFPGAVGRRVRVLRLAREGVDARVVDGRLVEARAGAVVLGPARPLSAGDDVVVGWGAAAGVAGVAGAGVAGVAGSVVWAVRRVAMSAPQRSRGMRTREMYPRAAAPQPVRWLAVRESP
jgi:hypothetical protein